MDTTEDQTMNTGGAEHVRGETPPPEDPEIRNLIVNYLPYTVDHDELQALFANVAPVESAKVIYDRNTQQSLGYGFVLMDTSDGARRAIEEMSGYEMGLKRLRVSLAAEGRRSVTHVYVAGLERTLGKDEIAQIFSPHGVIEEVKILREPGTNVSRGVAFVHYSARAEAEAAIGALHDSVPEGMTTPITVRMAEHRRGPGHHQGGMLGGPMGGGGGGGGGGIGGGGGYGMHPHHHQHQQQHQQYNSGNGGNQGQHMGGPMGGMGGAPRYGGGYGGGGGGGGYGYGDGMAGGGGGGGGPMGGGGGAPVGGIENPESTLFVFNLPPQCDEGSLFSLFAPFGSVTSVKVVRDQVTRACRGFGFVSYSRRDEASLAISRMNGVNIAGKGLQVSFKKPKNRN